MTTTNKKIAVVRVRGKINKTRDVQETFKRLRLNRQNHCVILEPRPDTMGMVLKVKDYVTWGTISEETEKQLITSYKEKKESQNAFRLKPPRKGYGRKGIKKNFSIKGALGYRGEKMDDLVKRML